MAGSTNPNVESSKTTKKKRPYYGGGMPAGHKTAKTLSKEQAREALREVVLAHMDDMLAAQVANSKGIKYLVVRDKRGGKFLRVTESMAKAKEGSDEEIIEVWEKDPSVQAFSDLMNRALDKPAEQEQTLNLKMPAMEAVLARLAQGRERVAKRG